MISISNNNFNKFRNFNITKEHIESKVKLEMFLNQMKLQEKLKCEDFKVIDMEVFRNECYSEYDKNKIELEYYNWFNHYIIGRIRTIYDDYKLHKENKLLQKKDK